MKIYVPNLSDYQCVYVRGEGVIRAYRQKPQNNATVSYRDYYIDSNYIFSDGEQTFGNYSSNIPVCLESSVLTDLVYYRNDFDSILVMFICLCIIFFYPGIKIIKRLFRRFN